MIWKQLYSFRSYLRSSVWVVPFVAIPLELIAARFAHRIGDWLQWNFLGLGVTGAQSTLNAIVTATLTFMVFTFGSLLVAIQVASGQLTPRVISTILLRNRVVAYTVGYFIFTLLFALSALNRIGPSVNQFVVFLSALLGLGSFAAFLYLIDYASRLLRPISILTHVGNDGLAVISSVYPDQSVGTTTGHHTRQELAAPDLVIPHTGASQIVLAVNLGTLLQEAERIGGVIEFVPQIGDFVATDEPLFNVYGAGAAADQSVLGAAVAFGSERTLEQDPTFAFRIVVDIALRALSPAINDPTTAVLAIDQLHRLLRRVGRLHLRTDEMLNQSGQLRVVFRTPNWEDFVHLSFCEIRACGSNNLQIVRRLRAMIVNLLQTLPAHRHPALQEQLDLIEREAKRYFIYPEDLALASVPDSQGLGGYSGRSRS
jgi:uncharacterized membrane protein